MRVLGFEQGVPLRVLREREAKGLSDRINFATVVTDLSTCHNTWFHKGVDRCFVATEEAAERARQMGLRPEQVHPRPTNQHRCGTFRTQEQKWAWSPQPVVPFRKLP